MKVEKVYKLFTKFYEMIFFTKLKEITISIKILQLFPCSVMIYLKLKWRKNSIGKDFHSNQKKKEIKKFFTMFFFYLINYFFSLFFKIFFFLWYFKICFFYSFFFQKTHDIKFLSNSFIFFSWGKKFKLKKIIIFFN